MSNVKNTGRSGIQSETKWHFDRFWSISGFWRRIIASWRKSYSQILEHDLKQGKYYAVDDWMVRRGGTNTLEWI
jgi:hypothetical protein